MFPHRFDEQRVFFQRFARMQDFVIFIIIDIRHADNEFEARLFGHRHKGIGQTERCGFRVIFFAVIEYVKLRRRDFFQSAEIAVTRVLDTLVKPCGRRGVAGCPRRKGQRATECARGEGFPL